jgi:hypothetical protein
MEASRGDIVIQGMDIIIKRDLDKHKSLLDKNNLDIQFLQDARSNEIKRRKFYNSQKGKRKYSDDAMDTAIEQMRLNIERYSSQLKGLNEQKDFNTNIVDTLTNQLNEYYKSLTKLK